MNDVSIDGIVYEKNCFSCRYLHTDEHEEPCRQCFGFDEWVKASTDPEEIIKDWERRILKK